MSVVSSVACSLSNQFRRHVFNYEWTTHIVVVFGFTAKSLYVFCFYGVVQLLQIVSSLNETGAIGERRYAHNNVSLRTELDRVFKPN